MRVRLAVKKAVHKSRGADVRYCLGAKLKDKADMATSERSRRRGAGKRSAGTSENEVHASKIVWSSAASSDLSGTHREGRKVTGA